MFFLYQLTQDGRGQRAVKWVVVQADIH